MQPFHALVYPLDSHLILDIASHYAALVCARAGGERGGGASDCTRNTTPFSALPATGPAARVSGRPTARLYLPVAPTCPAPTARAPDDAHSLLHAAVGRWRQGGRRIGDWAVSYQPWLRQQVWKRAVGDGASEGCGQERRASAPPRATAHVQCPANENLHAVRWNSPPPPPPPPPPRDPCCERREPMRKKRGLCLASGIRGVCLFCSPDVTLRDHHLRSP